MTVAVIVSALLCAAAPAQESRSSIFQLAWKKSLAEAVKVYPALANPNSGLSRYFQQLEANASNPGDANHALLSNPNGPRLFADLASKGLAAAAEQEHQRALDEAGEAYPDLHDANSLLWKTAHRLAMDAEDPNNANHALLARPDAPMLFARLAAEEIGYKAPPPPDKRQFYVITRQARDWKTTSNLGWQVSVGDAYPLVRYMSSSEYNGGIADDFDRDYVVLKLDDGEVVVRSSVVQPAAPEDVEKAAATYDILVKKKKILEARAARDGQ